MTTVRTSDSVPNSSTHILGFSVTVHQGSRQLTANARVRVYFRQFNKFSRLNFHIQILKVLSSLNKKVASDVSVISAKPLTMNRCQSVRKYPK